MVVDFGNFDADAMTSVIAMSLEESVPAITEILTAAPSDRRRLDATNFNVEAVVSVPVESDATTKIVDDVGLAITSGDLLDAMVTASKSIIGTDVNDAQVRDVVLIPETLPVLEASTILMTLDATADPTNPTATPTMAPTTSPTHDPTKDPTDDPTMTPTTSPTDDLMMTRTQDPTPTPTSLTPIPSSLDQQPNYGNSPFPTSTTSMHLG